MGLVGSAVRVFWILVGDWLWEWEQGLAAGRMSF